MATTDGMGDSSPRDVRLAMVMDARMRKLEAWAVLGHLLMAVLHWIASRWHVARWGRGGFYVWLHRALAMFSAASLYRHARRLRSTENSER